MHGAQVQQEGEARCTYFNQSWTSLVTPLARHLDILYLLMACVKTTVYTPFARKMAARSACTNVHVKKISQDFGGDCVPSDLIQPLTS